MSKLTQLIRAHPIAFFIVFACLLGWVQYRAVALGAQKAPPDNVLFGVIIAAAFVAASIGRMELMEWWRTLMTVCISLGWYALAIVAPVVVIVATVLANHALDAPLPTLTPDVDMGRGDWGEYCLPIPGSLDLHAERWGVVPRHVLARRDQHDRRQILFPDGARRGQAEAWCTADCPVRARSCTSVSPRPSPAIACIRSRSARSVRGRGTLESI